MIFSFKRFFSSLTSLFEVILLNINIRMLFSQISKFLIFSKLSEFSLFALNSFFFYQLVFFSSLQLFLSFDYCHHQSLTNLKFQWISFCRIDQIPICFFHCLIHPIPNKNQHFLSFVKIGLLPWILILPHFPFHLLINYHWTFFSFISLF